MDNVVMKNMINLLIDRLCGIKLCFDGYLFLFVSELIVWVYYFFVISNNLVVMLGIKIIDGGYLVWYSFG